MKKLFAGISAAVLGLACLTACDNSKPSYNVNAAADFLDAGKLYEENLLRRGSPDDGLQQILFLQPFQGTHRHPLDGGIRTDRNHSHPGNFPLDGTQTW